MWVDRQVASGSTLWHASAGFGTMHAACLLAIAGLLGCVWLLRVRRRAELATLRHERTMRQEIEAYAELDAATGPNGDSRPLAKRVCRTVAASSRFTHVAMLVRDAEGKLYVAGSLGMDDLTVRALEEWGDSIVRQERGLGPTGPSAPGTRLTAERTRSRSFVIALATHETVDHPSLRPHRDARHILITMLRTQSGSILGALAVCGEGPVEHWARGFGDAMAPLEILAVKLARTMENNLLAERLMRSEKLAGLGQLAGGVAHELNNPLTAVLGFAELIAETSSEVRVREDADTIIREALRMRETIESLLHFWRPVTQRDEPVDIAGLLAEMAHACAQRLQELGITLTMEAGEELPAIRGNRDRLRQVLEHLLNNAAQAIASARDRRRSGQGPRLGNADLRDTILPRGLDHGDLAPAIRVTLSHDGDAMHLIVSDTGPGFKDPTRAFDPFYTTRQPGEGAGLGLSICYGIVREHGGDISAFNLHPHGAAVVVELPIGRTVTPDQDTSCVVEDKARTTAKRDVQ